jgi:hypothetical protein
MSEQRSYFEVRMFSIIGFGFASQLVWYTPGPHTISTLAPRSARPPRDLRDVPEPTPLARSAPPRAAVPVAPNGSQTPACSQAHESSHTQDFVRLRSRRRRP